MKRRRRLLPRLLLLCLAMLALAAAFWFGLVPQRWSPFSPVSLERAPGLFLDFQLAALRRDRALCLAVLKEPHIDAQPIPDSPRQDGCGWVNSVRLSSAGGVRLPAEKLSCEMAVAVTLWIEHALQPIATELLGSRVAAIQQMGTYSCRNIVGNKLWKDFRSQHATANAVDIGGFTLEDGRSISVLKQWPGDGREAQFLRRAHRSACRYFRVALGPDFNVSHRDHFHFDRGPLWTCK